MSLPGSAVKRTHVLAIYWPPDKDEAPDPYTPHEPEWQFIRSGVPANLQPLTGSVQQAAAGRTINATWKGFIPPDHRQYLIEDALVIVLEGDGPEAYRIGQIGQQGPRWDTEIMLEITMERPT